MSSMSGDQLQPDDTLEDQDLDDVLDEGYSPPDREPDHLKHPEGGESLDERLAEEEPDVGAGDDPALLPEGPDDIVDGDVGGEIGEDRTGRLIAPDEGAHEDDESALIASDGGIDGAAASAEEAAMHTIDDSDAF